MRSSRVVIGMILAAALPFSCAPSKTASTAKEEDISYYEDLGDLRPDFSSQVAEDLKDEEELGDSLVNIVPKYSIGDTLTYLLDSLAIYTRENLKAVPGYTIQVYTGNSKDEAFAALRDLRHRYGEYKPKMSFDPPVYKVKIGKFLDRLEVHRFVADLQEDYPRAIIIPDRIAVNQEK